MGKVLIALCTVFLLAFPARGEQAVTWERDRKSVV